MLSFALLIILCLCFGGFKNSGIKEVVMPFVIAFGLGLLLLIICKLI